MRSELHPNSANSDVVPESRPAAFRLKYLQVDDKIRFSMAKRTRALLTLWLLLVLAAVFFAPSVDLEPTALRALRAAALIYLAIFVASHIFLALPVSGLESRWPLRPSATFIVPEDSSLLDLYCSRLC